MANLPKNEHHYAVVIGIDDYPGITPLRQARRDAEGFYDWLVGEAEGGVPVENATLIRVAGDSSFKDPLIAEPTREQVNNALRIFYKRALGRYNQDPTIWPLTRLYFYASGHGLGPNGGESAVLMANAAEDAWGENIGCQEYLNYCEGRRVFSELVFFADCCRHDKADALAAGPLFTWRKLDAGPVKTLLSHAAQLGATAYQTDVAPGVDPNTLRSYFTTALLEGLRGAGAEMGTREVTAASLAEYVKRKVEERTSHKALPQSPTVRLDPSQRIVLARLPVVNRRQVRISVINKPGLAPLPASGILELFGTAQGGGFQKLESHHPASGPWTVELLDGLYEVRWAPGVEGGRALAFDGMFRVLGENRVVEL